MADEHKCMVYECSLSWLAQSGKRSVSAMLGPAEVVAAHMCSLVDTMSLLCWVCVGLCHVRAQAESMYSARSIGLSLIPHNKPTH